MKKYDNQVFLVLSAINQNRQTGFTINPGSECTVLIQGWSEKDKGPGPWKESHKDTRDVFRVASAHTGWTEWRLGWQLLIYFKGREESKRIRDAKTRDETVIDKLLTFAHSYFLRGKGPTKPGHGCQAAVLEP